MKKLTKLLSLALAILMVMSLAATAFADGESGGETPTPADPRATPVTVKIKLTGAAKGAQFNFYKLCDAVKSDEHYTYTVNSKYSSYLKTALELSNDSSDDAIIAALRDKTEGVQAFADSLYESLNPVGGTAVAAEKTVTADTKETGNKFSASFEGDAGYYLIAQTVAGSESTDKAYSLVMLDTGADPDNVKEIPVKMDLPVHTKKVVEVNDSRPIESPKREDGADFDLNDEIEFYLTGSVAKNITSYENPYKMIFHDTPCTGLQYVRVDAVTVRHIGEKDQPTQSVYSGSYQVNISATGFDVVFADMKDIYEKNADSSKGNKISMHGGEEVTVKVIMKLTNSAVTGKDGNENKSYLEYSNNPYVETETGRTPDDIVKVYTHKLTLHKVDDSGNKLTGAGFKLYKYINIKGNGNTVPYSWDDCVQVGEENFGLDSDNATFVWDKLDAGTYKIEESTVPENYTKADTLYFTINSTYDADLDQAPVVDYGITVTNRYSDLTAISSENPFSWDNEAGNVEVTVKNIPGTALPSTGGIGTTLFYVFGSVLAIGAGVLLVSKKRMGAVD